MHSQAGLGIPGNSGDTILNYYDFMEFTGHVILVSGWRILRSERAKPERQQKKWVRQIMLKVGGYRLAVEWLLGDRPLFFYRD